MKSKFNHFGIQPFYHTIIADFICFILPRVMLN